MRSAILIRSFCPQISQSVWSPQTVERSLQDSCLPFLRLASVMSTVTYDTPVPVVQVRKWTVTVVVCLFVCLCLCPYNRKYRLLGINGLQGLLRLPLTWTTRRRTSGVLWSSHSRLVLLHRIVTVSFSVLPPPWACVLRLRTQSQGQRRSAVSRASSGPRVNR